MIVVMVRLFFPLGSRFLRRKIPNPCNQRETVPTGRTCQWAANSWVIRRADHFFYHRQELISSMTSIGRHMGQDPGAPE